MGRPWVTPKEVKAYSDLPSVQIRQDEKLQNDIQRAESYIIHYCRHDFSAEKYAGSIPKDVRMAAILLAEHYAYSKQNVGKKKSETFDDYSYTMSDDQIEISNLDLDTLLDQYVENKADEHCIMRLRKKQQELRESVSMIYVTVPFPC